MKLLYIMQGTPATVQDGSYARPYQVHPDAPDEFDAIFKKNRGANTFLLYPGDYQTRGCYAFPDTNLALIDPNSCLIGRCGSQVTKISLASGYIEVQSDGTPIAAVEALMLGGLQQTGSERMIVGGFTLDVTAARHPTVALHAVSSGAQVLDVRVKGLRGSLATAGPSGGPNGEEGFGILVNDGPGTIGGGSKISDCSVELNGVADSYCTAIYLGSLAVRKAPNAIHGCYAKSPITAGQRQAHAAFACNENTQINNCTANGFERFVFSDTKDAGDIVISGCRGDFGYCAIDFPALQTEKNTTIYRRRIRVTDCILANDTPTPGADHSIFIKLHDDTAPHDQVLIAGVDVDGCIVTSNRLPGTFPAGFYVCSVKGALAEKIWIRNSMFPSGARTTEGVYPPTLGGSVVFEMLR
jgi:hypothetical protein